MLFALLVLMPSQEASAWGREGHETIAKIAERHLTKRARKRIERYLGGHSIVYYAKWADEYRHTPEYRFTNGWHSTPVDADCRYNDSLLDPEEGNAIFAIEKCSQTLQDYRNLPDSTVAVNLKLLIHFVGDMHCPSHIRYPGLKVKNVVFRGKKQSYHGVWDSGVLNATHDWSYSEYADHLDRLSKKEIEAISEGTPSDWFEDSARNCRVIYDWAQEGSELDRPFLFEAKALVEDQITRAGYRLARVLNDLF